MHKFVDQIIAHINFNWYLVILLEIANSRIWTNDLPTRVFLPGHYLSYRDLNLLVASALRAQAENLQGLQRLHLQPWSTMSTSY